MTRSVVIHGHFYQPPRDDPWTGVVDEEPAATPDHDWNARILRECYAPLAGIAPVDGNTRENLLVGLSFNVGATLFEWFDRASPETAVAFVEADRRSVKLFGGHGNAIAMPYDHVILPLTPYRDQVTEVRWGIKDFAGRFGRAPEGMWLPETAVNEETLDVLAAAGIRFTILAPHQVENPPEDGLPITVRTSRGRSIAVFAYDGPATHDLAFGELLNDPTGVTLASRLAPDSSAPAATDGIVTAIATDGETFGHHHKLGARALASGLRLLGANKAVRMENFAAILARNPRAREGRINNDTSWSCSHGIERWRSNCGDHVGPQVPGEQQWRVPLRDAFDWLSAQLYGITQGEDGPLERARLRMLLSDGWFFDTVTGTEVRLMLRLAAYAMALSGTDAFRAEFLKRLEGPDHSGALAGPLVPPSRVEVAVRGPGAEPLVHSEQEKKFPPLPWERGSGG